MINKFIVKAYCNEILRLILIIYKLIHKNEVLYKLYNTNIIILYAVYWLKI